MYLPRHITVRINHLLEAILPPVIRDSGWFMPGLFFVFLRGCRQTLQTFKARAAGMTHAEFKQAYAEVDPVLYGLVSRETDASEESTQAIEAAVVGATVLDVGCGRGYLAGRLARQRAVTGYDMVVPEAVRTHYSTVSFVEGPTETLPFPDASFDTVVCAHTLEHVPFFMQTVRELRRVARTRLIIVLPQQRPYRYTFELHLHFFPYPHSLLLALNEPGVRHRCEVVGGDLLYIQDLTPPAAPTDLPTP